MVVKRFGLVAIVALLLLAIPLWLQPAVWGQEVGDTQPDHERVNDEGTVGAAALTLPPGFVSEVVIDSLSSPTTIAFGPENRVFIGQKNGFVRVWQDGVLLPTPFIDLRAEVNTVVDRGLLGIAVHPQFPTQPYIYLLYTYDPPGVALDKAGARVSRLLRVTADAAQNYNVASTAADARQVILGKNSTLDNIGNVDIMTDNDHPSCWNATTSTYVVDCLPSDSQTHSIGTVRFAADGSLFVGAGEGAMPDYVDPRALRALDVDSLAGKILRINPETGQGYADNPFYDGNLASNRSRVYSYGLRNPFRFTLHPTTGELYLGDVGWNQWEEVNSGRAKNFGWPCYEGNNVTSAQQKGYANNVDTQARCAALYAQGLDAVTAPLVAYNHMGLGAAVSGVAIYTGTGYPVEYQGVLFVSDYNSDWIQYVTTDESGKGTLHPFAEDVSPDGGPVQLLIGPDSNLIYVIYNKGTNTSEVRRIRYTSSANTPPTAIAKAAPLSGSPPLTVTFSATESFDPDGQNLQYFWLFGDGASATTVTATHVYNAVGVFPVRLWVTDTLGAGSVDQLLVETDNNAPVITITLPVSGTTFSVGDTISFSGSAADAEDGNLSAQINWEVLMHHNEHVHFDYYNFIGASSSFVVPDHGDNIWLEVCADVADNAGLYAEQKCVNLYPNTVDYHFDTTPSGLQLVHQGIALTTPYTVALIVGGSYTLIAPPEQDGYGFAAWSDGGARTHTITVQPVGQSFVATYTLPTSNPPSVTLTSPAPGVHFTAPALVKLAATASDTDGAIAAVEFYQGVELLGADTAAPYEFDWTNVDAGVYTVTAVAYDNSDDRKTSAPLTVTVNDFNRSPVAGDDTYTVLEDSQRNGLTVLDNDSDPDGDPLSFAAMSIPTEGGLVLMRPQLLRYTPAPNFHGIETFSYSISDGQHGLSSAQVTITVQSVNDPPIALDDTFAVTQNGSDHLLNVLANDTTAPDVGETLVITTVGPPSQQGVVTIDSAAGVLKYRPAADFTGSEVFSYTVGDGNGLFATAQVTVQVTTTLGALAGHIYLDVNGNQQLDAQEPGIAGALVSISGGGGASPLEVITDASGGYSFVDLPSGDYMVQVTLPAGYFATASNPFTARVRAGTTSQVDMGTVIRVQLPLIRN